MELSAATRSCSSTAPPFHRGSSRTCGESSRGGTVPPHSPRAFSPRGGPSPDWGLDLPPLGENARPKLPPDAAPTRWAGAHALFGLQVVEKDPMSPERLA